MSTKKTPQAEVTRLAKAIHASHLGACEDPRSLRQARAIPWSVVEAEWACVTTKERADYRWEAAQVLRTIACLMEREERNSP